MKVLTLYHPYPELIALEEKTNETRSWYTDYRGPLAIHVATSRKPWHMDLAFKEPFFSALKPLHREFTNTEGKKSIGMRLHLGQIIAICNLTDCLYIAKDGLFKFDPKAKIKIGELVSPLPTGSELIFGDYSPGRFAWTLSDAHRLKEPILVKGRQRIWNWDEAPHLVTIDPYVLGDTAIWTPKGIQKGKIVKPGREDAVSGLEVVA
ncbi:MAG: hypothetical protein ABFD18_06415 [Syntrophomonas sp.]